MSAGHRTEGEETRFLAFLSPSTYKARKKWDGLRGLPSLRVPFGLTVGAGLLTLLSLWSPSGPRADVSLTPLVAELAPSLSLPVSMNERVDRWMERYLNDQRPAFERYLAREGLYSEMIKEALRAKGMPEELFYLAAIESGFSPGATSRVSASGMWQFMGPTAEQFGLQIDEYVDERRDPIRATEAALDYLQALHGRFGSWYLAAAAYNAGPGRVSRALRAHSGDQTGEKELYWEIIELLPRETRAYVPKMLALIVLGQAAEDYGFRVERADPVEFDRVWVPGGTSLRWVAKSLGRPVSKLRELNPHLIRGVTPPNALFPVRIPPGTSPQLVASGGGRWRTVSVDD
ncbi:MAG: lytic transglycosylase domain-containing protein [Gemmatimonadetes bacterium]|nr:lytic transglycosylase domain-containing protein [Gemmatimonadota bacterium]NNM06721.1 lytic transglycosylase domain-containing protein [Gemmatimonadota bacterium]